jgi:type I restriction enzyme R subunit
LVEIFGLDIDKLKVLMNDDVNEFNLNQWGRFDELKNSVDKKKARAYFGMDIKPPKVNIKVYNLLKKFILSGGKVEI